MRTSITCLVVLVAALPAYARIINVPADFPTIQAGIDASVNGDTVLVAPGEYHENINPEGRNIVITGVGSPDTTIVQGYIRFDHNEDSTCIFQGFKVIGQGLDPRIDVLPIVFIENSSPKITANILRSNTSGGYGGGVGIANSAATIRDNIIERNWGWVWGGGLMTMLNCESVQVCRNIVRYNRTGFYGNFIGQGAGIWCAGGEFKYNLIYGNEVRSLGYENSLCGIGGGMYVDACEEGDVTSSVTIVNNTITGNIALRRPWGDGGGIYVCGSPPEGDTIIIENNIVASNNRGGLYCPGRAYIAYDLFYGDSVYEIIAPDTSETNIFGDPLLADTVNDDYHLLPDSPCIDAGDPSSPLDPDSTRADVGALFFDQSVGIDEETSPSGPYSFDLHQNYPNPFNPQTTISYTLRSQSVVNLKIYDITGKIMRQLVKGEIQEGGEKRYIWDGSDLNQNQVATAIYFFELNVNGSRQVKSMILLR